MLAVVTVLTLVGMVTLGVVLWQRDDDTAPTARDTESATGGDTATSQPSAEATTPPEPSLSAAPVVPPSPSPTSSAQPPPQEPSPEPSPSSEPPPDPGGTGAFSYTEYGDDWNFRLGDVELRADFERGWDYDTCAGAENAGALTDLGCVRASEWTYRARGGDLALSHIVLTMGSERRATRAIRDELIEEASWRLEDAAVLPGAPGSWQAVAQAEFVVITVETHRRSVPQAKATEFLDYANADIAGALAFRF